VCQVAEVVIPTMSVMSQGDAVGHDEIQQTVAEAFVYAYPMLLNAKTLFNQPVIHGVPRPGHLDRHVRHPGHPGRAVPEAGHAAPMGVHGPDAEEAVYLGWHLGRRPGMGSLARTTARSPSRPTSYPQCNCAGRSPSTSCRPGSPPFAEHVGEPGHDGCCHRGGEQGRGDQPGGIGRD
jgi:hypothetical protein